MVTYIPPNKSKNAKTIGNLDGTSAGIGGTDTIRVQSGTGDFFGVSNPTTTVSATTANASPPNIRMQNVGVGAGVFARAEPDGVTFDFRRLQASTGMAIAEVGDSIVFTSTGGVDRFIHLKDAPSSYVGQNGKTIVVDEASSVLRFVDFPAPVTSFLALTDTPDTYAFSDGKVLAVDAVNGKIKFIDLPAPPPTIDTFLELTDTPDTYAMSDGKFLSVDATTNSIKFVDAPVLYTSFLSLTDTPDSYAGANGEFLSVNETTGQLQFTAITFPPNSNKITYAPAPPTSPAPQQGDGWWDTTDGSFYLYYQDTNSGQWVESGGSEPGLAGMDPAPYDYGAFFDGSPLSGQTIYRWRAPRAHILQANFTGCLFTAGTAPSNDFICPIFINGAQVGTWTIAGTTGAATLVSSVSGPISVAANIEIKIVAPIQTDGTIADLVVSFKGERTE